MQIEQCYNKDYTFVDVRTPKEFEEDTVPGAINIPLFQNDERAIVGTIYKKESKEKAMEKGLEIVKEKLGDFYKEFSKLKQPLVIFCWRGGMRSKSIVQYLKSFDIEAHQLERGYKAYRAFVREQLETIKIPKSVVLYGYTGAGKTEVINRLDNGLDLEGCANHRGSILGDINLKPHLQKKFESLLLKRLEELKNKPFIVIECESRKIGKNTIPEKVFKKIKQPWKTVFLDKTVEERTEISYKNYYFDNKDEIIEKLQLIKNTLGAKKLEHVTNLMNTNKVKEAIKLLLVDYYDGYYKKLFIKFDHTVKSDEEFLKLTKTFI
ncbi:tRNA 2-selenouridine(34) synthase MnmH [archaeon]|jgi:tRNA 2-selenouridine synthase|nr:tRNA 2-selenouridine(34) synthase MnmH [archaeon]MBT4416552.1 tRNA 2-selenouridine(34) synthase MnmH [archaeon]